MNKAEWVIFQKELFTAFPGFGDYVSEKSQNPAGTLASWYTTLEEVSLSEAKEVLNEWLQGYQEPPKAYERDYIAIAIRSRIGFKRRERSKYDAAKKILEEKEQVKRFMEVYSGVKQDLASMFDFAIEVAARGLPLAEYNKIVADEFYRREGK
jgi:hypothetical protein